MYNSGRKKVIISVISDLITDQRVNRAALTLHENGFEVILVGRILKNSLPIQKRPYQTVRFKLLIEKGPLFYLLYNIRLFFFLLANDADIYLSNDLDTLLANFTASFFKKVKLVYDSHEYFTEVPELISSPSKRSIWLQLEEWIFPHLKYAMTVNDSIANIYSKKYKLSVHVIRNVPKTIDKDIEAESRQKWNIPLDVKIFLFQGAGINVDRGAEEAIESIGLVPNAVLLFIGGGDVINKLKKSISEKNLSGKVFFIPKQPMDKLACFTKMADFGLTLDKDNNLNYRYSLPNKLFDYIHAGLPILATNLPEVRNIVEKYDIGLVIDSLNPEILSAKMLEMMNNKNQLDTWKKNLLIAASDLCWEKEQHKFLRIFSDVIAT